MKKAKAKIATPPPAESPFCAAVSATPGVAGHCKPGLQAVVAADRGAIVPGSPKLCDGSLYIDGALKASASQDARWDYAISYKGEVVFVEVHPADGGKHVHKLVAKVEWLKEWLKKAPSLAALPRASAPYRWVHTGPNTLTLSLPGSRYERLLRQHGISLPVNRLTL